MKALGQITEITGGSVMAEAEVVLRRAISAYHTELVRSRDHGLAIWVKLENYKSVRPTLLKSGDFVRIREQIFTYDEMVQVDRDLDQFLDLMKRRGWPEKRTLIMLTKASKRAAAQRAPAVKRAESQPNGPLPHPFR